VKGNLKQERYTNINEINVKGMTVLTGYARSVTNSWILVLSLLENTIKAFVTDMNVKINYQSGLHGL
jgi:hypothetical protein